MAINGWIPVTETITILAVTIALVYKYADLKRTDYTTLGITGVSWYLSFSIIFFIPLDIYTVSRPPETFDNFLF